LAHELDDEVKVPSEIDELSALGPDTPPPAAQPAEEELMDVAALAALTKASRRGGADASEAKSAEGDVVVVRGRGNAAVVTQNAPAAVGGKAGDSHAGRRWWLPLAIGIGVGAALSALVFSWRPAAAPGATASPSESSRQPDPSAAALRQQAREATATGVLPAQPSAAEASAPVGAGQSPAAEPGVAQPGVALQPDVRQAGVATQVGVAQPGAGQPPGAAAPSRAAALPNLAAQAAQRSAVPESGAARPPATAASQADARHAAGSRTPGTASNADHATGAPPDSEEARLAAADHHGTSDSPLDSVLDDAFTQRGQQRTAAAAAALPLAPNRDDVIKAMTVLVPAIRGCAQGQSGLATAALVVRNDGRVETVSVSGQPFEGAASGRCMEGVVRRARFPHFQQPSFRVQFPFSIE
jgi:hypothetical protein